MQVSNLLAQGATDFSKPFLPQVRVNMRQQKGQTASKKFQARLDEVIWQLYNLMPFKSKILFRTLSTRRRFFGQGIMTSALVKPVEIKC